MSSVIVLLVFVAVIIVLAAFFWFWQKSPIDQVPPHLDDKQLRRLEVQDRLRQTNYQVLTAIGLGATFLITLFQFATSTQHWSAEFEGRLRQERLAQFAEAVKQITQANGSDDTKQSPRWTANLAGIRVLAGLGAQQPKEYHAQTQDILSTYVKERTTSRDILIDSAECANDLSLTKPNQALPAAERKLDREEPDPGVQTAMTALGEPKFASFRRPSAGFCGSDRQKPPLRLEHLFLDDLDLSNLDLSCSRFSNSRFRRVSLQNTDLSHADLRGIGLADFDVPGSPAAVGDENYKPYETVAIAPRGEGSSSLKQWLERMFKLPVEASKAVPDSQQDTAQKAEADAGTVDSMNAQKTIAAGQSKAAGKQKANDVLVKEWKLYRCWISDLRFANLTSANLEGSRLGGVDFRNADLTDVNFCRADVSRANFQDTIGLDLKSLQDACVGTPGDGLDYAAQPVGLPSGFPKLRRCNNWDYKCANEKQPPRTLDFRAANLTGVNFCRADVSKMDFQNAVGLNLESLKDACAGEAGDGFDQAAQPVGLPKGFPTLRRCNEHYQCNYDIEKAKEKESLRVPMEPIQVGHNLVLACFLTVAWITFWLVARYAKIHLEVATGNQTVEFPSRFPEQNLYTAAQLSDFVREHPARSRFYVRPILFPLDVIVMVLLGASMATASYYWTVQSLPVGWTSWAWAALVFPALYVIADLIEDIMLAWTLTRAATVSLAPVSENRVWRLRRATRAKFLFISAAILQTIGALLIYGIITSCNWPYFAKACVGNSYPDLRIVLGLPTDLAFLNSVISRDQPR